MALKVLVTFGLLAVVWLLLFRGGILPVLKRRSSDRPRSPLAAQELVKCKHCGIYLPTGQTCDCAERA